MRHDMSKRPTIGVLVSWPAYEGTTIVRYLHRLFRGMRAAAAEEGCNLLLACDMGMRTYPPPIASAWPFSARDGHFVPVGPWNTDGLLVATGALSAAQDAYLTDLMAAGHPVVFASFPSRSPSVVADNVGGIRQAVDHLRAHGHTRIAFIADAFIHDHTILSGDGLARLEAYQQVLHETGLEVDPRLVVDGGGNIDAGRRAMQQILASGAPFTALLAHNDLTCIGAMEALREAGLRVPQDVAVIGFDDILDARAQNPPLTTVHHPTFTLGQQAVRTMLDVIAGRSPITSNVHIPTRLVIRGSCGCRPALDSTLGDAPTSAQPRGDWWVMLARTMADATLLAASAAPHEIGAACLRLIETYVASLRSGDAAPFIGTLITVLRDSEARDDDVHGWQAALSTLRHSLPEMLPAPLNPVVQYFAEELLDQARLEVSERVRRQTTRALVQQTAATDDLGLMTAELLATFDETQVPAILAAHLPRIGVRHMQVARFVPVNDDPVAQSTITLSYGLARDAAGQRFVTRQFPPSGLYPSDRPFQLVLLPLAGQEVIHGFVAFDAANLEPCAAIARNLAAALRSSQLYAAAVEGRQQAEEANRLKSRFLSMVSHDLRTPLNLIIGLSEMVLREQAQAPAQSEGVAQDIKQIYTSAQHLGQMIGDVLDLASSEAGQLRLLREPLDLAEVLGVVALTGEQMARKKGLAWRAHMPNAGPWLLGDRTRLRQVVLNLISNAVKFTPSGTVTLEVTVEDSQVTVAVSDTGVGVPLAEQERIFDEFQRGEQAVAREYGGLGLGLAICKQLIELHGGTIGVRSDGEEGHGATFFFSLPAIAANLALPEPVSPPERALAHEQPIVFLTERAEDDPSLDAYLSDRGRTRVCRVDMETDWLPELLGAPPEVIVLDVHLAAHQGWQILDALQRHPTTAHLPLVVCALDPRHQHGTLFELQFQRKPLDATQLSHVLIDQGILDDQQTASKTILIVDDDPGILGLHTRLVRQQSAQYRVLQARNGREALAVMCETRPDLVLLDLLMPELDGFGVLEAMRTQEQTRDIPVVVLTAQTLTEAEMERLNQGVATILSKGLFSPEEIASRIDAVLERIHRVGGVTQRLVHKAIAYIHEHYAEHLSRTQIAQHVGVDENYLTDCFHQRLGVPPMTYLTRYRIKQARALLTTGDQSVTDIALAVGFADSAHFSRVFQREVGVPPSRYRRGERPPS